MNFRTKRSVTTTRALISAVISTQLVAGQVFAQTESAGTAGTGGAAGTGSAAGTAAPAAGGGAAGAAGLGAIAAGLVKLEDYVESLPDDAAAKKVLMALRSLPQFGSVIPMDVIIFPEAMIGKYFSF